eukprot:scaffold56574_cov57-Phaeocystis_antarctica.AAC.2
MLWTDFYAKRVVISAGRSTGAAGSPASAADSRGRSPQCNQVHLAIPGLTVKQVHRWVYRLTSLGHQHWVCTSLGRSVPLPHTSYQD